MADNLPDGTYYIRSTTYPYRCVDVHSGQYESGRTIQLYEKDYTGAQVWIISTKPDGTRRILNRWCGKSMYVSNGQVVLRNDGGTQSWEFEDVSGQYSDITTDTGTYSPYLIRVSGGPNDGQYLDAQGNEDWSALTTDAWEDIYSLPHVWFFEPLPDLYDGGIYEIRSKLNPRMTVDILDGSGTNGANAQLYYSNGSNSQKWMAEDSGEWDSERNCAKWRLRNMSSNKYLGVFGGVAQDGQNIAQYEPSYNDDQLWCLENFGPAIVDGKTCGVYRIGTYAQSDSSISADYKMDAAEAAESAFSNIQVCHYDGLSDAQVFMLYPTDAEDSTMPTPFDLGLATAIGSNKSNKNVVIYTEDNDPAFYPMWRCSKSWTSDGSNHYEFRCRSRIMKTKTSSWDEWDSWSQWMTASVIEGENGEIYLSDPIYGYDWINAKNMEYEFQVRCAGGEHYATLHSPYADVVCRILREPEVEITGGSWTPEGIGLRWTSDYNLGTTFLHVNSIKDSRGEMLQSHVVLESPNLVATSTVPAYAMKRWPDDGATLTITYTDGYDQYSNLGNKHTATITVAYDSGTVSVNPTLVEDGIRLIALVPTLGEEHVWVASDEGVLVEAYQAYDYNAPNGYTPFDVPYAFKDTSQIFTLARNSDGSQWGSNVRSYTSTKRAYGFNWNGGSAYLRVFIDDHPAHNYSRTSIYEASALDARKYETVAFAPTKKGEFTATGVLLDDSESSLDDFKDMLEAGHVIYRDIGGRVRNVAITGYTISEHPAYGYTDVSVSMIEETI